jgi:hypothetical protein
MSATTRWRETIARLRAGTAAPTEGEAEDKEARERQLARMTWALNRIDDMKRAQKALDDAWMKLLEPYDDCDEEELPDIPDPPEEAAFQKIWAEVMAAVKHDRWPAHLHFTAI